MVAAVMKQKRCAGSGSGRKKKSTSTTHRGRGEVAAVTDSQRWKWNTGTLERFVSNLKMLGSVLIVVVRNRPCTGSKQKA
jgi:hypothetical protein